VDAPAPVRRRKGLLDPNDLRGSHLRSQGTLEGLDHVRRWVLSVLIVSTILHLSAGTAALAVFKDDLSSVGAVVLLVVSAVVGVLAVLAGRVIHGRHPLSTWLVLGLVPSIAGATFTWA
jgi:hypothetical protein